MLTGDEWWRPMPTGASPDALHILAARGVRAFADGFVSLLLPIYLVEIGFSSLAIGAIVACTLIGTALLTLWVGLIANRHSRRLLLLAASLLMTATGAGFAIVTAFWPLLLIAFVGTMNPTSGDASIFQPLEQTVLTQTIANRRRTALFARYSVIGSLAGAAGVLAAAAPDIASEWAGCDRVTAMRVMFGVYGLLGILSMLLYRPLSPAAEAVEAAPQAPLQQSRRLVYGMAALFGMDSFGTGFLVQSLLALWLYQTFQVSVSTAAAILFWSGVCSAVSYLVAVPIAERIGLINTMVFTHLPSNIFLMLIPFAPNLSTAIGLLLARSALSQMDVPTRASYVMAVVTPQERPAAASITAAPKTFAWAAGSMISGYLLTVSAFGWPLLIGGAVKAAYDILLLVKFQRVRPPEEIQVSAD
ncbi:MAG TPA: MFS transporter [Acetobacteraceae bacterium]|jgi:MFS family permease|nr:MFS transporter [Acetobacteraceae bacterium]